MKLAILGFAPGWERAPFGDPSWRIAGLNDGYMVWGERAAQCTEWWEIHGDTALTRARRPPDHFDRMKALDVPLYFLHGEPPTSKAIRINPDELALQGMDYFACTFAYAIAQGLKDGVTEIAMYGTPLASNREIIVERPCVAYWLGIAQGRGVKIAVDHDQRVGLLKHPYRYAYADIEDRLASYDAAYSAFWGLARWIPEEDYRLTRLGMDPSDVAAEARGGVVNDPADAKLVAV